MSELNVDEMARELAEREFHGISVNFALHLAKESLLSYWLEADPDYVRGWYGLNFPQVEQEKKS